MSSVDFSVLSKHLERTFNDVAVQVAHAQSVRGAARSGYYKAAILFSASIAEALLHYIVTTKFEKNPSLLDRVTTFNSRKTTKKLQEISPQVTGSGKKLWICEIKNEEIFKLGSFKEMNILALRLD